MNEVIAKRLGISGGQLDRRKQPLVTVRACSEHAR
jgi:hypothetical protein